MDTTSDAPSAATDPEKDRGPLARTALRLSQYGAAWLLTLVVIFTMLHVAHAGWLSLRHPQSGDQAALSDRDIAQLRRFMGLDKPIPVDVASWLVGDDWMGAVRQSGREIDAVFCGATSGCRGQSASRSPA